MTFFLPLRRLLLPLLLSGAGLAQGAPGAADDSLYRALGGTAGLKALSTDFVARLKSDAAIGHHFKDVGARHLSQQLADQFCVLSGGPCTYDGEDMEKAHAGLGVTKADFHVAVELLQAAMAARGIPFRDQNRLVVLLAPMHRDIVSR
jgi:hemoglobin